MKWYLLVTLVISYNHFGEDKPVGSQHLTEIVAEISRKEDCDEIARIMNRDAMLSPVNSMRYRQNWRCKSSRENQK